MQDKKTERGALNTDKMVAKFMSASTPIESYLQEGKTLTDNQLEMVSLTISGLQTFLHSWMGKHRPQSKLNSFLEQLTTKNRPTKKKF